MTFEWTRGITGEVFVDDSDVTVAMRGHFFFVISGFIFLLVWHTAFIKIMKTLKLPIPPALAYPGVEITAYMAMAMGMLDQGLARSLASICLYLLFHGQRHEVPGLQQVCPSQECEAASAALDHSTVRRQATLEFSQLLAHGRRK